RGEGRRRGEGPGPQGSRHEDRRHQRRRRESDDRPHARGVRKDRNPVNKRGAAGPPGMPFTNNTEEDWDRTFAVNTKSVFLTCKAVAPHFIERKAGRIVNIASIAGPISAPTMPPYSVAKMGVITLTRIVAKELAPHGVTVNAICPGVLWTDFWQKLAAHLAETNPAFKGMTARQVFDKRVGDITPMKREQTPEDIGWAAVFLASDEARNITGQALNVDGGVVLQ